MPRGALARLGLALCLGASVVLAACSSKNPEPTPEARGSTAEKPKPAATEASPPPSAAPRRPREERLGAASAAAESAVKSALKWDDPPAWVRRQPSNAMRIAEYGVPKRGKDPEDAELVVNTFASGPGNTVEANIDRWVRQFDPQGSADAVTKKDREVKGLKVHTVSLNGTYKGMMMPGSGSAKPKEKYRLVGAVVEAPNGLWFFKMTGPEATVKGAEPEFEKLIDSLRKADDAPGGAAP
jgi:hypothetical protein